MGKKRVIEKGDQAGSEVQSNAPSSSRGTGMKEGRVSVYSSYNNTIISLADRNGSVVFATSAGRLGFKGSKKSTPFAASKVAETVADVAKNKGVERIWVAVRGIGPGRESALRSLGTKGFEIQAIKDATGVPHNGPRPRKVRRV
ncbi:MAG: 30S ribosomal protein S11 [Candidatus Wildermuthbacteria bacterium]|nr:30S ribosomal protein S11 [Candidatus Wildermuthbacteria bacterium]